MARQRYLKIDGKYQWVTVDPENTSVNVNAPTVIRDELSEPLQNPVTGTIHTSRSAYLKECEKQGLQVIGNDLLSKTNRRPEDKLTDKRMFEALQQAEAIHSDPSRKRAWEHEQHVRLERVNKLMKERR